MNVKKLLCVMVCVITAAAFAPVSYAEDSALIPADTLRLSVNWIPSVVFRFQEWDNVPSEKDIFLNTGFGAEYGITGWFNLQLLWFPGINWRGSDGYGRFHDLFAGTKAAVLGRDALFLNSLPLRFSAALGINVPVTSIFEQKGTSDIETDTLLWGSVVRLYYDHFFHPYFTLNGYAEAVYYPRQISANSAYGPGVVDHRIDVTGELEPRFQHPIPNGDILVIGLPLRFFYSPSLNSGYAEKDLTQYCFTASLYIGITSTRALGAPFKAAEAYLRYDAPILGQNVDPLHRVSVVVKVLFGRGETE